MVGGDVLTSYTWMGIGFFQNSVNRTGVSVDKVGTVQDATPLARHGTPWRHNKNLHRYDTGKLCRNDDHKTPHRQVF